MRRDVRALERGEDHDEADLRDEVHGVGVYKAYDAGEGARRRGGGHACLVVDREEDVSGIIAHAHVEEVGDEVRAINGPNGRYLNISGGASSTKSCACSSG